VLAVQLVPLRTQREEIDVQRHDSMNVTEWPVRGAGVPEAGAVD